MLLYYTYIHGGNRASLRERAGSNCECHSPLLLFLAKLLVFSVHGALQRSSRPCTWAGGEVASMAVNVSRMRYECSAPLGTTQLSPGWRSSFWPSRCSSARPDTT